MWDTFWAFIDAIRLIKRVKELEEGNPAGAFTEALRTVEGFGLHWPQDGSDDGKKGAA